MGLAMGFGDCGCGLFATCAAAFLASYTATLASRRERALFPSGATGVLVVALAASVEEPLMHYLAVAMIVGQVVQTTWYQRWQRRELRAVAVV